MCSVCAGSWQVGSEGEQLAEEVDEADAAKVQDSGSADGEVYVCVE